MPDFVVGNREQAKVFFREQRIALMPVGLETIEYLFKAVLHGTHLETTDLPEDWTVKCYGLVNEFPEKIILFIHSEEFPIVSDEVPIITPEMRKVNAS